MKITKVLMLASIMTLAACSPTVNTSSKAIESTSISSSIDSKESVSSASESTSSSSSSDATSTNVPSADKTLTVNLYNPTCGSLSKEVISERLAEYINGLATTTFVNSITGNDCQITNNIPNSGEKVLQLGAAEKSGSMTFTFTVTVKSVTIVAQTYYKPWVDTWSGDEPITYNNTDPNSVLMVATTGDAPVMNVDLKPGEDEKPVEKEFTIDMNANKLQLTSANKDNGRVFIKSLVFVY